ncbi:MAG: DUF4192 family protein [Microbacteriaceae bacterium]
MTASVLRATSTADFLALVPEFVGLQPHDSMVVVPFVGTRSNAAARFDLPRERRADQQRLASVALGLLSRMAGVDGAAIVVYTDETFAEARGIPQLSLARIVRERLQRGGFGIVDIVCIAGDGWGSYLDRTLPREGRPLAELEPGDSLIGLHVRAGDPVPDASAVGALPEPDPIRSAIVLRHIEEIEREDAGGFPAAAIDRVEREVDDNCVVCWTEYLAGHTAEQIPLEGWAYTAVLLTNRPTRDVVLLQLAFGETIGVRTALENEDWHERMSATGLSSDDLARTLLEAGEPAPQGADLLMGRTRTRPDVERCRRAIVTLGTIAVHTPDDYRAPLLTITAWLCWALGQGTACGRLLQRALEADADYGLARVLAAYTASGAFPEWSFADPNTATDPTDEELRQLLDPRP